MRSTAQRGAPWLCALCLICGAAGLAQAQGGASAMSLAGESQTVLFVPPLEGAVLLGAGLHSRVPLAQTVRAPDTMAGALLGGRWYLDQVGRVAVGAHVRGSLSLPETGSAPALARHESFWGVDGGLHLQLRGMNEAYIYGLLGLVVELGVMGHDGDADPLDPLRVPGSGGTRWYVGLESGFGFLGYLDPYIYGESGVRLGLEWLDFSGAQITSLHFAWEVRLDFAWR